MRVRVRRIRSSIIGELLGAQAKWVWTLIGVMVISGVTAFAQARLIKRIFDDALIDKTRELKPLVSELIGLAFINFVLGLAGRQVGARIAYHLEYDLRQWLYRRLAGADPQSLDRIATGQVVTRSLTDLYALEAVILIIPLLPGVLIILLVLVVILFIISPLLAIVTLAALPLNIRIMWKVRHRLRALFWVSFNRRAEVTATIDESVRGIRVVKSFSREDHERERVKAASSGAFAVAMTQVRLLARYSLLVAAVPVACVTRRFS